MGEKGAEVAPAPVPSSSTSDEQAAASIASIFGNIVDSAVPGSPAPAQPIGELGPELSGTAAANLRPTIPDLPGGSTPTVDAGNLGGVTPTPTVGGVQPPGSMPTAPEGVQPPGIKPLL